MDNYERALAIKDEILAHRHALHQIPEIGLDLPQTVAYVKARLTEMGYEPQDVGKGVVATVGKPGKTILLRADMDALPVQERSGLPFASTNGNCHACGHDIHTSMLLGAAKLLKEQEAELKGTVKLMFQPGEEGAGGARNMLEAGVMENPKVDRAIMIHAQSCRGVGVALEAGVRGSNSDGVRIVVHGKGGHAARPYEGVDAVYIAAQIIIGLQEIITRELPYDTKVVLSLCHIEGGKARNAMPETVLVEGSLRTFDPETRDLMGKRIVEVAEGIAKTYRGWVEAEVQRGTPVVINDATFVGELRGYLGDFLKGRYDLRPGWESSGSEDFAYITHMVPATSISVCLEVPEEEKRRPLHNPEVLFNEEYVHVGSAVYTECAMRWLEEHG